MAPPENNNEKTTKKAEKTTERSAFRPQKLKHWKPKLSPKWLVLCLLVASAFAIPFGIVVLQWSDSLPEFIVRYDDKCPQPPLDCRLQFEVPVSLAFPIYVFYQLDYHFFSHKRFAQSRSYAQLKGEGDLSAADFAACDPIVRSEINGLTLYPCGLVASSFFNDAINVTILNDDGSQKFLVGDNWLKEGIAWQTDFADKYKTPRRDYEDVTQIAGRRGFTQSLLLPSVEDEDLMVWMRTPAFPTFKKLYRVILNQNIDKGKMLDIQILNYFPVKEYGGAKSIVFATRNEFGPKSPFIGYGFIALGVFTAGFAIIFLVFHLVSEKPPGDMSNFHWNHDKGRVHTTITTVPATNYKKKAAPTTSTSGAKQNPVGAKPADKPK